MQGRPAKENDQKESDNNVSVVAPTFQLRRVKHYSTTGSGASGFGPAMLKRSPGRKTRNNLVTSVEVLTETLAAVAPIASRDSVFLIH